MYWIQMYWYAAQSSLTKLNLLLVYHFPLLLHQKKTQSWPGPAVQSVFWLPSQLYLGQSAVEQPPYELSL